MALWGIEEKVKHYFADELEKEAEMTGAQFVVKFLEKKEVAHVFGIPGAAILPFYDAVLEQEHMRAINVHQGQTAIFMAEGYARSTGKVGICALTSGGGTTNFLTGLNSAHGDSIPLIVFTGQVTTNLIGKDAFQEAPIVEMARVITKAIYLVTKTEDLPKVMSEAWRLATQGRKGPVLIDIPVNVQKGLLKINLEDYLKEEKGEHIDLVKVSDSQLEEVFTMIEKAERPVLLVGGRVAGNVSDELIGLAQLLQIPIVSSLMGKDGFPNYHHLYAGIAGPVCQTQLGNKTIYESDLIVNLGEWFDSRSTGGRNFFKEGSKIIHINITEEEILFSHHIPDELVIASDVKNFILKLHNLIRSREYKPNTEALKRIESLRIEKTNLARQAESESSPLKSQQMITEVRKGIRPDAIVTLDWGLGRIWASQLYDAHEPRTFLIDRAGAMGWSLGAAMGAQLAYPQRQVVNLLGDASLGMSLEGLATAVKHDIPVVIVVFRKELEFATAAKGMGVEAELVEKPEQITDALTRAFSAYRPYLIEILVDSDAQRSVSTRLFSLSTSTLSDRMI
ncbi:thiamine pyrophosphate-binding protein [Desulfosporosinus nitroreducens]|uniref:thiamine pyrophosphate-binding protein n=1 Tax=Desulfosporosinus nitroreducens TaxID=2018668 RepID=UPI00207CD555|nr:thiamine pyrophosphate-binding protein [Desulfosporosinus nitroreducens]MCO1601352.1 thiamine pyrophosphate-binding protein [Desulfosporosinus nitroreducens]